MKGEFRQDLAMNESVDNKSASELEQKIGERLDPILAHLKVADIDVDKDKIRTDFIKLWEYEDGENLSEEEQFLTTVASFIYVTHNNLDDYNIRIDRARDYITDALRAWVIPEIEKQVAAERKAEKPFKAFVDNHLPVVDEKYTWRNFLLDHKQSDEKAWTYKMKKCWFATFFIRLGRVDFIQTACLYDQIPWEARKDYVDLKLNNRFATLGTLCQFNYTPAKKDS